MAYVGEVPYLVEDWEWESPDSKLLRDSESLISHIGSGEYAILDCPCGIGSMTNRLSKAGYRMIGIDICDKYLKKATESSSDLVKKPVFEKHDMVDYVNPDCFDFIINWNNSFGYFSDEKNCRILENFHRSLKNGGSLFIEYENIDFMGNMYPSSFEDGGDIYWDKSESVMHYKYGSTECVRIHYSLEDLVNRIAVAGFSKISLYGPEFSVFEEDDERYIIEAKVIK